MEQDNIFNGKLKKINGELIYPNSGEKAIYEMFVASLQEGQTVNIFMEANKDDGTNDQLAKIHVCIRKLAKEIGYTFEEMKTEVKRKSGLDYGSHVKSFGVCSKEELGTVIDVLDDIADNVNMSCD